MYLLPLFLAHPYLGVCRKGICRRKYDRKGIDTLV